MTVNPPAGWYPDSYGTTRWWDGNQWTEHLPPPPPTGTVRAVEAEPALAATATAVRAPTGATAPSRSRLDDAKAKKESVKAARPWYKKKRFILPILLLLLVIAGSALGSETETGGLDQPSSASDSGQADAEPEAGSEAELEPTEPDLTAAQENALESAEDYLTYDAYSRKGLIQQLKFEGYSKKDANFAVDNMSPRPDWKEQAAQSAEDYLTYDSYSRSGLIQQLKYEGYTEEQATYGVNQTGL